MISVFLRRGRVGSEDWVEDCLVYIELALGTKFLRTNCLVITYYFLVSISKNIEVLFPF